MSKDHSDFQNLNGFIVGAGKQNHHPSIRKELFQ
jgi:hypothetical protein